MPVASILHRHPRTMFANRLLTAAVNANACACDCIGQKSYSELPYKPPTLAY